MAVTMICIGMPVCRPAVCSMLHVLGFTTPGSSNSRRSKRNSNYPATSSYIRNFGHNATWEQAVAAEDVDTWSQRRILGMGHATSNATSGGSASDLDKEGRLLFKEDGGDLRGEIGFPMRTMSKSGITVTKTVDVTNEH